MNLVAKNSDEFLAIIHHFYLETAKINCNSSTRTNCNNRYNQASCYLAKYSVNFVNIITGMVVEIQNIMAIINFMERKSVIADYSIFITD